MSVIVTISVKADGDKLEAWARDNEETIKGISNKAQQLGAMAHRFYGDDNGNVMVFDEWPDSASFQTFFQGTMDQIGPMMAAVGAQGEPQVSVWRELDTRDKIGWGA